MIEQILELTMLVLLSVMFTAMLVASGVQADVAVMRR